jgi:lysophospholipase L1-like esterase
MDQDPTDRPRPDRPSGSLYARPKPGTGAGPAAYPGLGPDGAPPPRRPRRETDSGSGRRTLGLLASLVVITLVAMIGGIALAGGIASGPTASPSPSVTPTASPSAAPSPLATASPTVAPPTPTPSPTPVPTPVPLPSLLGAIGDSYTQAWSVSPSYLYDHPQFSWAIGTDANDGVTSLLERFRALGASPSVVDAATSGKQMNDALRQANLVVAAAQKLGPGQTAYVTFELGTNDLCASPNAMTDPALFQTELTGALAALRAGLPAGSRILMLPVPDFAHFRAITQADPTAKALLAQPANANRCAPYLGTSSASALTKANGYLALYDAALKGVCDDIDANEATTGRLYCVYNAALLADSDFTIDDLSTYDYFHPSLAGQAKMAQDAWAADVWGSSH